jgi:O-antigen/teichoic acid export membrane protein
LLRSATRLAIARQGSALLLVVAFLVLPELADGHTVSEMVWAYFAVLIVTSATGFGVERMTGVLEAERIEHGAGDVRGLFALRFWTIPLNAVGILLVTVFVRVHLGAVAFWGTVAWCSAALFASAAFSALRARGSNRLEPVVVVTTRLVESSVLLGLAARGSSAGTIVVLIALVEIAGASVATRAVGVGWSWVTQPGAAWSLPWRRLGPFVAIEPISLAYSRSDLLLVGRMVGSGAGAAYGLLYRVLDGLIGAQGAANLWLFAASARRRAAGRSVEDVRSSILRLLPAAAVVLVAVLLWLVGPAARLLVWISGSEMTLCILLISFPCFVLTSSELHLRSGADRNREVLIIGALTLGVNLALNLALIPSFDLLGAAVALLCAEVVQTVLVAIVTSREERQRILAPTVTVWIAVALLVVSAVALDHATPVAAVAASIAAAAAVLLPLRRARVNF